MLVQHCTVITGVQPCGTGSKPFDLLVHMVLYYHVVMWYRGPMVLWCGAGSTIFDLLLVHMDGALLQDKMVPMPIDTWYSVPLVQMPSGTRYMVQFDLLVQMVYYIPDVPASLSPNHLFKSFQH